MQIIKKERTSLSVQERSKIIELRSGTKLCWNTHLISSTLKLTIN